MSEVRIRVIGQEHFEAREWLRKDVLWASLMTPYSRQMHGWLDGTAYAQHSGNVTRQSVYAAEDDAEMQSLAFFNQGKNIAGLVSSLALFKSCSYKSELDKRSRMLETQAESVDRVLGDITIVPSLAEIPEEDIFKYCTELVESASVLPRGQFAANQMLVRASDAIAGIASSEASSWLDASLQDEEESLPVLTIHDGGHARSAGKRVNMLQPIFHRIVASPRYRVLKSTH